MHSSQHKLPSFLLTLRQMLDVNMFHQLIQNDNEENIRWTNDGRQFIISNPSRFSEQTLPRYFKHSNLSSFIRQLNIYHFKKLSNHKDPNQYIYHHKCFSQFQLHKMSQIKRKDKFLWDKGYDVKIQENGSSQSEDRARYGRHTGDTHKTKHNNVQTVKQKKVLNQQINQLQQYLNYLQKSNTTLIDQNDNLSNTLAINRQRLSIQTRILSQFLLQSYQQQYLSYSSIIQAQLKQQQQKFMQLCKNGALMTLGQSQYMDRVENNNNILVSEIQINKRPKSIDFIINDNSRQDDSSMIKNKLMHQIRDGNRIIGFVNKNGQEQPLQQGEKINKRLWINNTVDNNIKNRSKDNQSNYNSTASSSNGGVSSDGSKSKNINNIHSYSHAHNYRSNQLININYRNKERVYETDQLPSQQQKVILEHQQQHQQHIQSEQQQLINNKNINNTQHKYSKQHHQHIASYSNQTNIPIRNNIITFRYQKQQNDNKLNSSSIIDIKHLSKSKIIISHNHQQTVHKKPIKQCKVVYLNSINTQPNHEKNTQPNHVKNKNQRNNAEYNKCNPDDNLNYHIEGNKLNKILSNQ